MPLCRAEQIAVMPWSPLARGRLAKTWKKEGSKRSQSDPYGERLYQHSEKADERVVNRVEELARTKNCSMAQIALAWLLRQDTVTTPIVGITCAKQLEDAIAAIAVRLSNEESGSLSALYVPHEIAGHE